MPSQLDEHWEESTWPQRYAYNSFDVNYWLMGKTPDTGKHWSKTDVKHFLKWLRDHASLTNRPTIVYRGTRSGILTPFYGVPNKIVVSTSKQAKIAAEFSGKNGYIHVLHLQPGCCIFDLSKHDPVAKREQEVLLLPNHSFQYLRAQGSKIHWRVKALNTVAAFSGLVA
jgi:hypothetical protein